MLSILDSGAVAAVPAASSGVFRWSEVTLFPPGRRLVLAGSSGIDPVQVWQAGPSVAPPAAASAAAGSAAACPHGNWLLLDTYPRLVGVRSDGLAEPHTCPDLAAVQQRTPGLTRVGSALAGDEGWVLCPDGRWVAGVVAAPGSLVEQWFPGGGGPEPLLPALRLPPESPMLAVRPTLGLSARTASAARYPQGAVVSCPSPDGRRKMRGVLLGEPGRRRRLVALVGPDTAGAFRVPVAEPLYADVRSAPTVAAAAVVDVEGFLPQVACRVLEAAVDRGPGWAGPGSVVWAEPGSGASGKRPMVVAEVSNDGTLGCVSLGSFRPGQGHVRVDLAGGAQVGDGRDVTVFPFWVRVPASQVRQVSAWLASSSFARVRSAVPQAGGAQFVDAEQSIHPKGGLGLSAHVEAVTGEGVVVRLAGGSRRTVPGAQFGPGWRTWVRPGVRVLVPGPPAKAPPAKAPAPRKQDTAKPSEVLVLAAAGEVLHVAASPAGPPAVLAGPAVPARPKALRLLVGARLPVESVPHVPGTDGLRVVGAAGAVGQAERRLAQPQEARVLVPPGSDGWGSVLLAGVTMPVAVRFPSPAAPGASVRVVGVPTRFGGLAAAKIASTGQTGTADKTAAGVVVKVSKKEAHLDVPQVGQVVLRSAGLGVAGLWPGELLVVGDTVPLVCAKGEWRWAPPGRGRMWLATVAGVRRDRVQLQCAGGGPTWLAASDISDACAGQASRLVGVRMLVRACGADGRATPVNPADLPGPSQQSGAVRAVAFTMSGKGVGRRWTMWCPALGRLVVAGVSGVPEHVRAAAPSKLACGVAANVVVAGPAPERDVPQVREAS